MVWQMPVGLAVSSTLYGFVFALLPVMWIVWNAMWLYNVAVRSGKFDLFRRWMIYNVPPDKRILLLLIAFSFGALLEGVAGFGTLGAVTGLHPGVLGAMIGRQLPLFGLILPFYALIFYTGFRSLRTAWPVALVAGLSFALTQFTVPNFINYQLTDVLSALISLLCVIGFVQFWRPSDFLGWIACLLSGSDTSSNALFGNLQVVAARQLKLSPVLMAATNSSGAVMGKMVSPQNVTTAVSTTDLVGTEGLIVRRTIIHSLVLASALGLIVLVQQYLIPGIIP